MGQSRRPTARMHDMPILKAVPLFTPLSSCSLFAFASTGFSAVLLLAPWHCLPEPGTSSSNTPFLSSKRGKEVGEGYNYGLSLPGGPRFGLGLLPRGLPCICSPNPWGIGFLRGFHLLLVALIRVFNHVLLRTFH